MNTTAEITPAQVAPTLKKHILKDGFDLVQDLERSHGSFLHDSLHNRELLDFFTSFATIPLGYNHPKMRSDEGFKHRLFEAALANPANSDIYTTEMARFMATFSRVGIPEWLPRAFFVAGGALAVENAIKTAMDWKVQKNFAKGYTYEKGHKVLHFQEAFHGRSGYTMSLTNTDPAKTKWFAKFEWPRVLNPKMVFPYTDENHEDLLRREALSIAQIKTAFQENKDEICCIILEPIQGEGGDNHFRKEFMEQLRTLCDENEALLIFDEVQMGMGCTGTFWCHEQFGPLARPDIISFGKKMQVCGILAGPKVDEVETNVFRVSSRINSTWGGNLVDMVRVDRILEIMEEDNVLENVRTTGAYFQDKLRALSQERPGVTNVRGRGLICAFDLPTGNLRNEFIRHGREHNVLFLGCAERSIRFRPTLTITPTEIDLGMNAIRAVLDELGV